MSFKVIITGATGMVGEGVLLECLQNEKVAEVMLISRKHYELQHPKLKQLIVPDFTQLENFSESIKGYDACFFCAGISSVGMKEDKFTHITYTTTLAFAKAMLAVNNNLCFCYVSGRGTDSSEKGNVMWARVKGQTENELMKLGFAKQFNFRPGAMLPFPGQKNWKSIYKWIGKLIQVFAPSSILTMHEVGLAMINTISSTSSKQILEIKDIKQMAK
jgi:putative NADH-flavin reductase